MALDPGPRIEYISLMNKTTNTYASPQTGKVYTFTFEKQSRTAYAEFMNPSTRYEKVYYQVNVFNDNGNRINFGFVDTLDNEADIIKAVQGVVEWDESSDAVLESMHSRFD